MNIAFKIDYGEQPFARIRDLFAEHEEMLRVYGELVTVHCTEEGCRTYVVKFSAGEGWTARGFAEETLSTLREHGFTGVSMFRVPDAEYIADDGSIISAEPSS